MKKTICISFLAMAIALAGFPQDVIPFTPTINESGDRYQHDMDIARLNDLTTLGSLVEEYHTKKGHYPFEKRYKHALYVHITTKGQRKYANQRPPYTHLLLDVKEFITALERGLGRNIDLPFDPQKVPMFRPNFYIYKIYKGKYYLAVHLYNKYSFSRKIGKHYHKVEVSNYSQPSNAIWILDDLFQNEDFVKAAGAKPFRPGYVKEMRRKMYKEGAF